MTPTDETDMLSGEQLREIRTLAGMSEAEMGRKIGYDQSAVSRLEKGQMKMNPELQAHILGQMLPVLKSIRDGISKWV